MKPAGLGTWRQQFHSLNPVGVAAPIPSGTGQAFSLDEWLDFSAYLRSPAYETFWGPMGIHHVLLVANRAFRHGVLRARIPPAGQ